MEEGRVKDVNQRLSNPEEICTIALYSYWLLLVTSSYLLLVVRPRAPSSLLAPSGDALVVSCY